MWDVLLCGIATNCPQVILFHHNDSAAGNDRFNIVRVCRGDCLNGRDANAEATGNEEEAFSQTHGRRLGHVATPQRSPEASDVGVDRRPPRKEGDA